MRTQHAMGDPDMGLTTQHWDKGDEIVEKAAYEFDHAAAAGCAAPQIRCSAAPVRHADSAAA